MFTDVIMKNIQYLFLFLSCFIIPSTAIPSLKSEPHILVEGDAAVVTCSNPTGVVEIVSKADMKLPDCVRNSTCNYYSLTSTYNSLSVRISKVSRTRDAGLWKCIGHGLTTTLEIRAVRKEHFVLIASYGVYKINAGTEVYQKLDIRASPTAVAYDPITEKIYWSSGRNLQCASNGASKIEQVTQFDLGTKRPIGVYGIAIDHIHRLLYYSNLINTITVLSLENYDHKWTLLVDLDKPRSIVLLPDEGILFWTEYGSKPSIGTANMDGTNKETFISLKHQAGAMGLAIDRTARILYWADLALHKIEAISLDKSYRKIIYEIVNKDGYNGFSQLVLLGDYLYVYKWKDFQILRLTKSGKGIRQFTSRTYGGSYGMDAYNTTEMVQGNNVCLEARCEQLCLPRPHGWFSCGCKNGFTLLNDKTSCTPGNTNTTVTTKPFTSVTIQPSATPQKVMEGKQLEFVCSFSSSGTTPSTNGFTWRFNGVQIKGVDRSVYNIQSVNKNEGGTYTCSHNANTETPIIHLDVLYFPLTDVSYQTLNVTLNTKLSLSCSTESNPQPSSYKWYNPDGTRLLSNVNPLISSIDTTESGIYVCICNIVFVLNNHQPISVIHTKVIIVNIASDADSSDGKKECSTEWERSVIIGCLVAAFTILVIVIVITVFCYVRKSSKKDTTYATLQNRGQTVAYVNQTFKEHEKGYSYLKDVIVPVEVSEETSNENVGELDGPNEEVTLPSNEQVENSPARDGISTLISYYTSLQGRGQDSVYVNQTNGNEYESLKGPVDQKKPEEEVVQQNTSSGTEELE